MEDHEFYSIKTYQHADYGRLDYMWLSVRGNEGWWRIATSEDSISGIYSEAYPLHEDMEPQLRDSINSLKFVGPKQQRKILACLRKT